MRPLYKGPVAGLFWSSCSSPRGEYVDAMRRAWVLGMFCEQGVDGDAKNFITYHGESQYNKPLRFT
jgi:hypothetical protein